MGTTLQRQRGGEAGEAGWRHSEESRPNVSFVPTVFIRAAPTCLARHSGNTRKPSRSRQKAAKSRSVRVDPILDDSNIDTTDITTYVSCPTCFNSIMLRPQQLERGPMHVTCNCCEKKVKVSIEYLENIDGTPFDLQAWRVERNSRREMEEVTELRGFEEPFGGEMLSGPGSSLI